MSVARSQSRARPDGPWPTAAEFNEAIQNLPTSMGDAELREGEAALGPLGLPMPYSGGFADVYRVHCPKTGDTWAVKCFTKGAVGLHDRYEEISRSLEKAKLPFMVDFGYLDEGVRISGKWYPIVKMRWVEGQRLNEFVAGTLEKPRMLDQLFELWVKLADRLRKSRIAHADLQHGNVMLVPKGEQGLLLRLIDYDGMYVPALDGKEAAELGHPNFQHPRRANNNAFSKEVDRFSHLAICSAVRCLRVGGPRLWERFDNGENLLFKGEDFQNPSGSALFRELMTLQDPDASALVGHLALATQQPLEQAPLLNEIVSDSRVRPLTSDEQREVKTLLNGNGSRGNGNGASSGLTDETIELTEVEPEELALEDLDELKLAPPEATVVLPNVSLADTAPMAAALGQATSPFANSNTRRSEQQADIWGEEFDFKRTVGAIDSLLASMAGPDNKILHIFLRGALMLLLLIGPPIAIYGAVLLFSGPQREVVDSDDPVTDPEDTEVDAAVNENSSADEDDSDSKGIPPADRQRITKSKRTEFWWNDLPEFATNDLEQALSEAEDAAQRHAYDEDLRDLYSALAKLGQVLTIAVGDEDELETYLTRARDLVENLSPETLKKLGSLGSADVASGKSNPRGILLNAVIASVTKAEDIDFVSLLASESVLLTAVAASGQPTWRSGLRTTIEDSQGDAFIILGSTVWQSSVPDDLQDLVGKGSLIASGYYIPLNTHSASPGASRPKLTLIEKDLPVVRSARPVKLAFKRANGVHTVRSSTITGQKLRMSKELEMQVNGTSQVVKRIVTGTTSGQPGAARVSETIQSLRITTKLDAPAGMGSALAGKLEYSFDSADPDKQGNAKALEDLRPFHKALANTKKVTVYEADDLVDHVEYDKTAFASLTKIKDQIKHQFDPKVLEEAATAELKRLPTRPVQSGDTWRATEHASFGDGLPTPLLTIEWKYTYDGFVDRDGVKLHKISGAAVSHELQLEQESTLKMTNLKMTGSASVHFFDEAKGRFISSWTQLQMKFDQQRSVGVEMTFEQTIAEERPGNEVLTATPGKGKPAEPVPDTGKDPKARGEAFLAKNEQESGVITMRSGLQYMVLKRGTGPSPKKTDAVEVHYRGTLIDGKEFDSSYRRGKTAEFQVNRVIPGWTEALQLMKVGGKWKIFVPSNLAYGAGVRARRLLHMKS